MSTIKLKNLKPGMVLADDVRDLKGRVLLARGETIDAKHLKILKAWGIAEVTVKGTGPQVAEAPDTHHADAKLLKKTEAELTELFRYADVQDPMMRELYNQCLDRKLKLNEADS